jgi:hypothetical protein
VNTYSIVARNIDNRSIGLFDNCKSVIDLLFVTNIEAKPGGLALFGKENREKSYPPPYI